MAATPFEEWIRFLKSGEISPDTTAPGLQAAREKLRVAAMSKAEQNAYEKYEHDVASFLLTQRVEREAAREEGRAEGLEAGRAEGLEEGESKKAREVALRLISLGMSTEIISQSTGLSTEEIEGMRP